MATYAAGVTASFRSVSFGEVQEIAVTHGGSMPLGRSAPFFVDGGTVEIKCLSTTNISRSLYGKRGDLAISGGGLTYTAKCVCETLKINGVVNDVAKYTAAFRIQT